MYTNTFPIRLKALLEQKKLTLTEVAKAINISATSVHRWTRGGEIEYDNLLSLANFLEVNWIWLRYGDEAIDSLKASMLSTNTAEAERRKYLSDIVANEARMTLAQKMAHIVIWEWNILTNELIASSNNAQILGRSIEDLRSFILPFENLDFKALLEVFSSTEHAHEWDFHLPQTSIEKERWFTSRAHLLLDALERPFKVVGVCIDITQRKDMQKALEKSEYTMRKVIETIPVGLWIADEKGFITVANPEANRIWGGNKFVGLDQYDEFIGWGESTGNKIEGKDWGLARAIEHGIISSGEVVNINALDGERRCIIVSATPLLDGQNRIIGGVAINQDITALKQAQKLIKSNANQWDLIFEQSLVGIACHKQNDSILYTNLKFAQLIHSSTEKLLNCTFENLLDENSWQTFQNHLNKTKPGESSKFTMHAIFKCETGETTEMQLHTIHNLTENSVFNTFVIVIEIT